MDLLEQCELDDEKLMGKSSRQRGPKVGVNERERGKGGARKKGPRASGDLRESAKKKGCQRGRGRGGEGAGR